MNRSVKTKKALAAAAALMVVVLAVQALMMCAGAEDAFAAKAKKPARVKITTAKRSGTKIIVRWKKAKNAKKYQVYVKAGTAKWKLRKTLAKLTLTVSGKYGTAYSFKVRGVNGKKKGLFSAVKKVTIPKQTTPVDPEQPEEPEHEKTALEIAADKVTDMILALPELSKIKETDQETIAAARKAYNRLPESAKVFVKDETVAILEAAERRLNEFPAENAEALILDLPRPEKMSVNTITRIQEAIAAYNALTEEQKALISDEAYDKLRLASEKLRELIEEQNDCSAANAVSKRIMKFWDADEITYSNKKEIEYIRKAYEALTDRQKEYVDKDYTLPILEAAEAVIAAKEEVIREYMVKWPKVVVGGEEFYKVVEKEDKVLLLATDRVTDQDGNYILMDYGETNIWRDSNVRNWLNSDYLRDHPALRAMVLDTEITTKKLQTRDDELDPEYITTTDKVFVLSTYDINGGATIDAEYTNGESMLAGLEKEECVTAQGMTWQVFDWFLPPTEGAVYDEIYESWTRTPVVYYFYEEGPYHQQEDAYITVLFEDNPNWPYNYTGLYRRPIADRLGMQPAMWVDRAKLEQAAE